MTCYLSCRKKNLIYVRSLTSQMLLERLNCIAERKNTLPEARKKKEVRPVSFILLQLEYNCKPCISKIVYELTGLN